MTAAPIAFRTNESKYSFEGSPRLINAYAEQLGNDAKRPLAVMPCAGLTTFATPTDRPCRGTIYLPDKDAAYTVHSTSAYKITFDGTTATSTHVGTIPGTDPVQLSRNMADIPQISISCAAGQFYIEADVVKSITDTDLIDNVVTQDGTAGYTIFGSSTGVFQLSAINDCNSIDGLDFATAEQNPDGLLRVFVYRGELLLFGNRTIEQWRNTGQADFPFEPIGGSTIERGLLTANGVADFENSVVFPGIDNVVYQISGSNTIRLSNHGIERTITDEASQGDILGFTYDFEGHTFYTLTGTDWSRSYDGTTKFWHSRESYGIGKWRAVYPFRAWGKVIFGDLLSGKLLELDKDAFTEDGDPLVWGVDTPVLHVFPNGGVVDALHIDVATGVGLTTGQGSSPLLMLDWSTDGGHTFKGNRQLSLGTYGDRVRVTTRRLGRFGPQGIQFRLRISDPVIRALIEMDIAVRPLKK